MTRDRDVKDLKSALDHVTPAAPHLAHTVIAAVRAAAATPPQRPAIGVRVTLSAAAAALFAAALIVAVLVSAFGHAGSPRSRVPAAAGSPPPPLATTEPSLPAGSGYDARKDDFLSLGYAASGNQTWIAQKHSPGYSAKPGQTFAILYRTDDGGETWVQKLRFPGEYDSMRFSADGRTGVVWGTSGLVPPCANAAGCPSAPPAAPGLVYRTSDGGDHWSSSATPGGLSVYAMFFLDAGHGWAILHAPVGSTLTTYATSDGGLTWQQRGVLGPPANVIIPGVTGQTRHTLQFSDSSHGVFTAVPGGLGQGWPVLLVTRDGGLTWQQVALAAGAGAPAKADVRSGMPTMFANGSGMIPILVSTAMTPGHNVSPNELYVSSTSDGGRTWTQPRRVFAGGTAQAQELVTQAYFLDASHWWVTSETPPASLGAPAAHHLLVSADGGRSWTAPLGSPGILDLVVANPRVGWAQFQDWGSGFTRLARTTDAGAHWATITVPPAAG